MKKLYILFLFIVLSLNGYTQSDTTATNTAANTSFLDFVKKVYFNPTILLKTQNFKAANNVQIQLLPSNSSQSPQSIKGFELAMQKVIRFILESGSEGIVRYYFNPNFPSTPFSVVYSEELHCKFTSADIDSITNRLNAPFKNTAINYNNSALFEGAIQAGMDYTSLCLRKNSGKCGDKPDNQISEINTKPLYITLHNTNGSKYDMDTFRYENYDSYYTQVYDLFTQQNAHVPAKLFVAGGTSEPISIAIHKREENVLKQNFKVVYMATKQILELESGSSTDSLKIKLPQHLPANQIAEFGIYYKSTQDSITYLVGSFMVHAYTEKTINLHLVSVDEAAIPQQDIAAALKKMYDPVGVKFNISTTKNITSNPSWAKDITIESSGLLSSYTKELRDYVGAVKDLNNYDKDDYYIVFGLSCNNSVTGYMPRKSNIGFVFTNTADAGDVLAHEIGHGAFHLRHIFSDEELGASMQGMTKNLMDYVQNPTDLYVPQWEGIDDPVAVGWFEGDDEEGWFNEAVPFRCIPPTTTKINNIESYISTTGKIVQLKENQYPIAFVGSSSEHSGKLLIVKDIISGKFYYSAKDDITYPGYYELTASRKGIDIQKKLSLEENQDLSPTIISIDQDCSYFISRDGGENTVGKQNSCGCWVNNSIVDLTPGNNNGNSVGNQPNILTEHIITSNINEIEINQINQLECNWFTLEDHNLGRLSTSQKENINSIFLSENNIVTGFKNGNGDIFKMAYWAKKDDANHFNKTNGSYSYICFSCLENDQAVKEGTSEIKRYVDAGKIYYEGIPANSTYRIEIEDENRKLFDEDEYVWSLTTSKSINCSHPAMTIQHLETAILRCNMLSACMSELLIRVDSSILSAFKPITRNHILDYLFTNAWVQHPYAENEYNFLDSKNKDGSYLLLELIKVLKVKGEFRQFVEGYLLNSNNGDMPLARLIRGNNNIEFRFEVITIISQHLAENKKNYSSPNTNIQLFNGTNTNVPNNANTLFIYYENWFQSSNKYLVNTEKNKVLMNTDEFSYYFHNSQMHISQSGKMHYYPVNSFIDVDNPPVPQFSTSYNDDYYIHPYSIVPVVFGKAFNELQIKEEGERMLAPACVAALFAQIGEEKASQQNQAIAIGAVAVLASVVTAGQSLWVTGAFATSLSTTGTLTTVAISSASAIYNTIDVNNLINEGTENLTPKQIEEQMYVRKIAGYLAMAEGAIGLHSLLKASLVELKAYQAFKNILVTATDYALSFVSNFCKLSKIKNTASIYYLSLTLTATSLNPVLIKTTATATAIENVILLETATVKTAGTSLSSHMGHTFSSLESMVAGNSATKLANVNYAPYKLSSKTVPFVEQTSSIAEAAFSQASLVKTDIFIFNADQKDIVYIIDAATHSPIKVLAYDQQGNTYKKDTEPECSTCTVYQSVHCKQFKVLDNKLPITEKNLITKLCGHLLLDNVTTVLNYFNAATTAIRSKWHSDLMIGNNTSYLSQHVSQVDGQLTNAWNVMNDARSPQNNQSSAFRYDWKSLEALRNLLTNNNAVNNLGGQQNITLLLKQNTRVPCDVCGTNNAPYLNKMDEYIKDLEYFGSNFRQKEGFDDVKGNTGLTGTQIYHVEGAAFMIRVLREEQLTVNDIDGFELQYNESNEKVVDIKKKGNTLIECKSWMLSGPGFQNFMNGSGGSYAQFLSYLQFGISSMTNLEYWFDKRKIDGTTNESKTAVIKQKFQQMMLQNGALTQRGEEIWNILSTKYSILNELDIQTKSEFINHITMTSNTFYNFILVK